MTPHNDIEEIAAVWLARQADGLSDEEQAQLTAWLDASAAHKTVFWRLEYSWEKASRLTALRNPDTLADTLAETRPAPRRLTLPRGAMGLAAALAVVTVSAAFWPRPAVYATDIGERRLVALPDGSRVDLNTQTRLRASISPDGREAWLDQGEAYFDVARDTARPFTVHIGGRTVQVLGTRFSIRRDGDNVRVMVAEGRVRLSGPKSASAPAHVILAHDEVATGDGRSTLKSSTTPQRVEDNLAWRRGLLVFDQITLSDAAKEFNRYNETQLIVGDARTADIRIGGSFEAANVEAFVRLLRSAYGLEIARDGENVKISE